MALDLSKVKEREALAARREPHWQRIRPGCFLGYRPSAREGAGTWIARAYDEEHCGYRLKALGDFGELPGRDRFAAAKKEVEAFVELVESGGRTEEKVETVEDACRHYAKANVEAHGRFKRHVYSDPIAKLKLAKVRRNHLKEWRQRLTEKPAMVSRRKKGEQVTRPRAPSSVNRDMAMLRAALNRILAPGAPNTEAAWQEALKPIRNADRQGHYQSHPDGAPLILFGIPNSAEKRVDYAIAIPKASSLILKHDLNAPMAGLDTIPDNREPPVGVVFWSFRVMVGLGFAMLGLGLFSLLARTRKSLYDWPLLHRFAIVMGPTGFVAVIAGWITTEVGRQPYTVYGQLLTDQSHSPLAAPAVAASLIAFVIVYFAVFGAGVWYLLKLMAHTPQAHETEPPQAPIRSAGITPAPALDGAPAPAE